MKPWLRRALFFSLILGTALDAQIRTPKHVRLRPPRWNTFHDLERYQALPRSLKDQPIANFFSDIRRAPVPMNEHAAAQMASWPTVLHFFDLPADDPSRAAEWLAGHEVGVCSCARPGFRSALFAAYRASFPEAVIEEVGGNLFVLRRTSR
jgi:hypothetical protein